LNYSYDVVDNLLSVTDAIAGQVKGTVAYTYDALDRATKVTQTGNGVSAKRVDMTYDAASQMTGMTRYADLGGTGLVAGTSYTYDADGRLTKLTHARGGNPVADYGWQYDAANRITQFTSADGTSNYNYDDRDQLTGTDHSYQGDESYSYDANGNRTNSGYNTGDNNQLLSDGKYNYEYDNEGNRTKRTEIATGEVTEYTWDYRNRLTDVVVKGAGGSVIKQADYTYDVYDRRIAKSVDADGAGANSATVERFVHDGDNLALVFDGNGNQTNRYLYGTGVDEIVADQRANGQTIWSLADNQGSVRDLVDNSGNVVNHISYDSFGNITNQSNPTIDTRFTYTGRELDKESGLYYYRARYYDAAVGGFISVDPIGFRAGDSNLYRYVFNSPTNYTDPSGEFVFLPLLVVMGGGALIAGTFNAIRQGIQIQEGSRQEFCFGELFASMGIGAVAAPIVVAAPQLAVPLAALGVYSGSQEIANGNYATGVFDIGTSVIPLAAKGGPPASRPQFALAGGGRSSALTTKTTIALAPEVLQGSIPGSILTRSPSSEFYQPYFEAQTSSTSGNNSGSLSQQAINKKEGDDFEKAVSRSLGIPLNQRKVSGMTSKGEMRNTEPDFLDSPIGVADVKRHVKVEYDSHTNLNRK
jgi:RHS repeat-associated protein